MGESQCKIADRISAVMSSMTSSEKRAARVLLACYPVVGLGSVTAFAKQAKVSAPTVLRFIAKLGFCGYPEFRRGLLDELDANRENPLTIRRSGVTGAGSEHLNELLDVVRSTLVELNREQVERVAELFSDERRNVYVLGGAFTVSAAAQLSYHLRKMRRFVFDLPVEIDARAGRIADIGKRDILAVFDIRRYQADILATARIASQRGCTVIVFTDQRMSEAAEFATYVFRAEVEAMSPWGTLLGVNAIVEMIALTLCQRLWSMVRLRLETIEQNKRNLLNEEQETD
ncbi:MurR/RpiR family transcriptional regulator (plasmid) [Microvirga sp. RSM25]|uniref:MurR/RpiR family transcriptional regulator n=1 Tax=Microvirga sp. RSM25 TaxID=3273802 RepID=UPI0038505755